MGDVAALYPPPTIAIPPPLSSVLPVGKYIYPSVLCWIEPPKVFPASTPYGGIIFGGSGLTASTTTLSMKTDAPSVPEIICILMCVVVAVAIKNLVLSLSSPSVPTLN